MTTMRPAADDRPRTSAAHGPGAVIHHLAMSGVLQRFDTGSVQTLSFDDAATLSDADPRVMLTLACIDGTEIDVTGTLQSDGVVTLTIALDSGSGTDAGAWTTAVPLCAADRFSLALPDEEGRGASARGLIEHSSAGADPRPHVPKRGTGRVPTRPRSEEP